MYKNAQLQVSAAPVMSLYVRMQLLLCTYAIIIIYVYLQCLQYLSSM